MADKQDSVKVELTPLLASCLQRMLCDEIDNQECWLEQDHVEFGIVDEKQDYLRKKIINECVDLIKDLESKGIAPHLKNGYYYGQIKK